MTHSQTFTYGGMRPYLGYAGLAMGTIATLVLMFYTGTKILQGMPLWIGCAMVGIGSWWHEPRTRSINDSPAYEWLAFYGLLIGFGLSQMLAYLVFRV